VLIGRVLAYTQVGDLDTKVAVNFADSCTKGACGMDGNKRGATGLIG